MRTGYRVLVLAALLAVSAACGNDAERIGSTRPDMSFEEFERSVYREADTGLYIVNGDTPIRDRDELLAFYHSLYSEGELIVHMVNGVEACWKGAAATSITYCVSQQSFGANYDLVVAAMAEATAAWEDVANVDFVHLSAHDGNCNNRNKNVVFNVRQVSGGQYLASAFFPNYSRRNSEVKIDTSSYTTSPPLTLTGILRHELGHVLGFRHEHTRPESGTCFEDSDWEPLTSYDSDSVMHYPQCNGTGDWSLTLTESDKAGAAALYGSGSEAGCCGTGCGDVAGDTGGGDTTGGDTGGNSCVQYDPCSSDADCDGGTCITWVGGGPKFKGCQCN